MDNKPGKKSGHKFNWTDGILAVIALCTIWFVRRVFEVMMVAKFEPSATVAAYFTFITAECGILWRIHENNANRESRSSGQADLTSGVEDGEDDIQFTSSGEG